MLRTRTIWKSVMASGKVLEGVFAINKPAGLSSAQVLRDLQQHFKPSDLFAPWLQHEQDRLERENSNQRRRRRQKTLEVKIGHGGTLDPLATGVLIAGVGSGTKHLQDFLKCTKTYEAVLLFGAATDSYDSAGKVVNTAGYKHVTREGVEKALDAFRGSIMQKPPIYSALKLNGKKLYEYARSGEPLPSEIQARPVQVLELEVLEWLEGGSHVYRWPEDADQQERQLVNEVLHLPRNSQSSPVMGGTKRKSTAGHHGDGMDSAESKPSKREKTDDGPDTAVDSVDQVDEETDSIIRPATSKSEDTESASGPSTSQAKEAMEVREDPPAVKLRMTVTSGFYVRSLCHDLGRAMDTFALMSELVRTRQGDFELGKNVFKYEDLENGEESWGPKVESLLEDWTKKQEARVRSARP